MGFMKDAFSVVLEEAEEDGVAALLDCCNETFYVS